MMLRLWPALITGPLSRGGTNAAKKIIKRLELWRDFQFEALYASVCRQREVVEARRLANRGKKRGRPNLSCRPMSPALRMQTCYSTRVSSRFQTVILSVQRIGLEKDTSRKQRRRWRQRHKRSWRNRGVSCWIFSAPAVLFTPGL